jgi:hypothetical protein
MIAAALSKRLAVRLRMFCCLVSPPASFHQAYLLPADNGLRVLTLGAEALKLAQIALAKIDAEGQELPRLPGSSNVLCQKTHGQ